MEPSDRIRRLITRVCEDAFIPPTECEYCGAPEPEQMTAMTAYYWDGIGKNPNRDLYLCKVCAEDYYVHWSEMWREYYASIL